MVNFKGYRGIFGARSFKGVVQSSCSDCFYNFFLVTNFYINNIYRNLSLRI
jgi:hypothetical protein